MGFNTSKIQDYFLKPRLLVLIIPYIALSCIDSFEFVKIGLFPLILFVLCIDFILFKINKKLLDYFFLNGSFFLLYSLIIYNDTYYTLHELSFANFSLFLLLIFALIFYYPIFKNQNFHFTNIVIIIFSLMQFFNFKNLKSKDKIFEDYNISSNFIEKEIGTESEQPIILIICDELTSSKEIFQSTNNILDLEFDNFLKLNNYKIVSKFKSQSAWTQFSVSSIFNFNLHFNDTIQKLEERDSNEVFMDDFTTLIQENLLVDSLQNKGIKSYSYGVLPFTNGEQVNDALYLWEIDEFNYDIEFLKNNKLLKTIFHKSVLNFIDSRFLRGRTYAFDSDRKNTLNKLKDITFSKNTFHYFHYFAPHSPHSYFDEYIYKEGDHINENIFNYHVNYRRFMLNKLIKVLKLKKFENTRIIITGDHGLRSDLTKFNDTMSAFKGFEEESISQLRSVQDIGTLILKSFKDKF